MLLLFALTWRATGFWFGFFLWWGLATVAALAWYLLGNMPSAAIVWPLLPRRTRQALEALRTKEAKTD